MEETNVVPLARSYKKPMTELEACQIRIRVLTAYLDKTVHGWREDVAGLLEAALRG